MEEQLRNAAARGDSEQVVKLLAEGIKNVPDESGRNALHLAAGGGFQDVVDALLLARWDINLQDFTGCTALQKAAAEGHVEVVKQLINQGANVNIQDKMHGNTPLHEASWRGYSKCVQALCQANTVNLQIKNAGGFTPLHLACQNGHNQSCRELLMANCDPDMQNNYGDTPLHTSARYGHAGVTRILISADCHMSDQNKNGDTALHIAAAMGRRKLTRILLEAGCDPHKRNKQNERAKDIAIRKDLNEIIEIIDKTVPVKKKEKEKEKTKVNEKKRGKESGSSKDSSTRPKEKKKPKNDHETHLEKMTETKWSPYGCHYYPDSKTFPKPKLDSLPQEPLKKGEQYYLDLAGNIRKGPVGIGYTCYCAPFFRHMEERLDRDKRELKEHIDAAQIRLDKKVTNLEVKTRSQLNEITRSMALERVKCQQRHLHLEQWLIRGSIFRNSEKPKPSDFSSVIFPKSKSLENILEEKTLPNDNVRRSVNMINKHSEQEKDLNDEKNRSSSREGKESGKGSSEVGDIGTSDGEEKIEEAEKKPGEKPFSKTMSELEKHERRIKRTTREISERIDQILQNQESVDGLSVLCDEMVKWRSYHKAKNRRSPSPDMKSDKENQRIPQEGYIFRKGLTQDKPRFIESRRSYHDLLKDDPDLTSPKESRLRRLSDPRGCVEELERKSVHEIAPKLQKQHTVKELVAKIQKKTGLIHKSAQKWKENKLKNRDKKYSEGKKSNADEEEEEEDESGKSPHNYENIRLWDVPQEKLSRLPYRCRNTVYSPSENLTSYETEEYQRKYIPARCDDHYGPDQIKQWPNNGTRKNRSSGIIYQSEDLLRNRKIGSAADFGNDLCELESSRAYHGHDSKKIAGGQTRNSYSPTQNDSGYSTKPCGGSSTGPSPSLSGHDFELGSSEIAPPLLSISVHRRTEGTASSLV